MRYRARQEKILSTTSVDFEEHSSEKYYSLRALMT